MVLVTWRINSLDVNLESSSKASDGTYGAMS